TSDEAISHEDTVVPTPIRKPHNPRAENYASHSEYQEIAEELAQIFAEPAKLQEDYVGPRTYKETLISVVLQTTLQERLTAAQERANKLQYCTDRFINWVEANPEKLKYIDYGITVGNIMVQTAIGAVAGLGFAGVGAIPG